jgi:hypothetical protein
MIGVSFAGRSGKTVSALHFDIFDGIGWLGVPLIPKDALFRESSVENGVRRLSLRARVLATVVHHVGWSGGLRKAKYWAEFDRVRHDQVAGAWLQQGLVDALGLDAARMILGLTAQETEAGRSNHRRLRFVAVLFKHHLRHRPAATLGYVARYALGQWSSLYRPPGVIACPGDVVPGAADLALDLSLACKAAPHAAGAPHVRVSAGVVETLNGPTYRATTRLTWQRWAVVRLICPTIFLWIQAKRNRIILLGRMPAGIRILRWLFQPNWIGRQLPLGAPENVRTSEIA